MTNSFSEHREHPDLHEEDTSRGLIQEGPCAKPFEKFIEFFVIVLLIFWGVYVLYQFWLIDIAYGFQDLWRRIIG